MGGNKNQISLVDLIFLQFLWICQIVCENVVAVFKWHFKSRTIPTLPHTKPFHEKRHLIQLYRTEPKNRAEKPICYINVIEFDSSQEEEIRNKNQPRRTFLKSKSSSPYYDKLRWLYCRGIGY